MEFNNEIPNYHNFSDLTNLRKNDGKKLDYLIIGICAIILLAVPFSDYLPDTTEDFFYAFIQLIASLSLLGAILLIFLLFIDYFIGQRRFFDQLKQKLTETYYYHHQHVIYFQLVFFLIGIFVSVVLISFFGHIQMNKYGTKFGALLIWFSSSFLSLIIATEEYKYLKGYRMFLDIKTIMRSHESDYLLKIGISKTIAKAIKLILRSHEYSQYGIDNEKEFILNLNEILIYRDQEKILEVKSNISEIINTIEAQDHLKTRKLAVSIIQLRSNLLEGTIKSQGSRIPEIVRYEGIFGRFFRIKREFPEEYNTVLKTFGGVIQTILISILSVGLAAIILYLV